MIIHIIGFLVFQVMAKWEESSSLVSKRDEELQQLFDKINQTRERIRTKEEALKEQNLFLQNEKGIYYA